MYLRNIVFTRRKKRNGSIPKDKVIAFKDNNQANFSHENLILITRAENAEQCRDTDGYIAMQLAGRDKQLAEKIKKNKPLMELKRLQLKLNKEIKQHEKNG
jgi:hypothetical protein